MPTATTSGGVALPEVAVPLGTHTGWNVTEPQLAEPAATWPAWSARSCRLRARAQARLDSGDARRSIAERYASEQDYLSRVDRAAQALVQQRLMLAADLPRVRERAAATWAAVAGR